MYSANQITISNIPELSAIYYALLQCGYDYYNFERSQEHIDIIQKFVCQENIPDFFSAVKQNTCEVYPYWPRAAMLEAAVFFLQPDHLTFRDKETFRGKIMSSSNISDNERDHRFWDWIVSFPTALNDIMSSDSFNQYMEWENKWVAEQSIEYTKDLQLIQSCLSMCVEKYQSFMWDIQIIVNPIKCVYSADYHLVGKRFVFCSGVCRAESVIHEFLHHVIHPFILGFREMILNRKTLYHGIDISYYLSGDDAGQLNAFEEYAVRELTKDALLQNYPEDISVYLERLLS